MKTLGRLFNVSAGLYIDKKNGKFYLAVTGGHATHPVYIEITKQETYTLAYINDANNVVYLQKLKKEIYENRKI